MGAGLPGSLGHLSRVSSRSLEQGFGEALQLRDEIGTWPHSCLKGWTGSLLLSLYTRTEKGYVGSRGMGLTPACGEPGQSKPELMA